MPPPPIFDTTLFWITTHDIDEAYYLVAIINSQVLYDKVSPLMSQGQWGPRHIQKHIWRLHIPDYDRNNLLHRNIVTASKNCYEAINKILVKELQIEYPSINCKKYRKVIRKWLKESDLGIAVEESVLQLFESLSKKSNRLNIFLYFDMNNR